MSAELEIEALLDARVVHGASCTWWGTIDEADTKSELAGIGLPLCPSCGRALLEVPDVAAWWADVREYAAADPTRRYVEFVLWLRGRCYRSVADARPVHAAWQDLERRADEIGRRP